MAVVIRLDPIFVVCLFKGPGALRQEVLTMYHCFLGWLQFFHCQGVVRLVVLKDLPMVCFSFCIATLPRKEFGSRFVAQEWGVIVGKELSLLKRCGSETGSPSVPVFFKGKAESCTQSSQ